MELMQMEMFMAVAEEGSFLKAAARVRRTQPAVSLSLARLEDEVGTPLFVRRQRRVCDLTDAGRTLYRYSAQMIALRRAALRALTDAPAPGGGGCPCW